MLRPAASPNPESPQPIPDPTTCRPQRSPAIVRPLPLRLAPRRKQAPRNQFGIACLRPSGGIVDTRGAVADARVELLERDGLLLDCLLM